MAWEVGSFVSSFLLSFFLSCLGYYFYSGLLCLASFDFDFDFYFVSFCSLLFDLSLFL